MSFYGRHVEREILSALIDGELPAEERRFVYEHLQQCAACREASEEFTTVLGIMGNLPQLVAPAEFVSRALESGRPSRSRRAASSALRGRRKWVAGGVAAAAVATTLAGLMTPQATTEPPVGAFVERHVGVHSPTDVGGQVLFAVNGR